MDASDKVSDQYTMYGGENVLALFGFFPLGYNHGKFDSIIVSGYRSRNND